MRRILRATKTPAPQKLWVVRRGRIVSQAILISLKIA
jgi:hypothetical protein